MALATVTVGVRRRRTHFVSPVVADRSRVTRSVTRCRELSPQVAHHKHPRCDFRHGGNGVFPTVGSHVTVAVAGMVRAYRLMSNATGHQKLGPADG